MKVREMIALLQQCDPDATVTVWDTWNDCECLKVSVSFDPRENSVHIGDAVLGVPLTPRTD